MGVVCICVQTVAAGVVQFCKINQRACTSTGLTHANSQQLLCMFHANANESVRFKYLYVGFLQVKISNCCTVHIW
jgi:hypothetical protein